MVRLRKENETVIVELLKKVFEYGQTFATKGSVEIEL
jgi:hypothetical protein